MRHALLDEFSILSIYRGVLNEFLTTDAIDALTKHHPTAFITICHHQRKETQLHVFVWRNIGSGPRYMVCASLGLSSPDIWETRIFPERALCCTHKSPTAKCRTSPNPSLWTITIAAVALPHGHTNRGPSKLTAIPYLPLLPSPPLPTRTLRCSRPGLQ